MSTFQWLRHASLIALTASLGGVPFSTKAQDRATQVTDEEAPAVVVVTAQKRSENLQKVAAAVTALSGTSLADKGISRQIDLQYAVPSLTITETGVTQNFNIRGVGVASSSAAVVNGVATYVDGLYQPPIVGGGAFFDIASVEAFRGPQGTFVGSNSTGGAIFINSQNPKPGSGPSGYVEVSQGNYNAQAFDGALNLPITDTMALRISASREKNDAYFDDLGPFNNQIGSSDALAGRVGLLWKPTDKFQLLLKISASGKDSGGYAAVPIPGTAYAAYGIADNDTLNYDVATFNVERAQQGTLEVKYQFDNGITFRSLSGYQWKSMYNFYDDDGTNSATYAGADVDRLVPNADLTDANQRVWSQEFNLISPTTGRLSWVLGGYYEFNKISDIVSIDAGGFPSAYTLFNRKASKGVFAQATFKLTPTLAIDVGGRYTWYTTSGVGGVTIGAGLPDYGPEGIVVVDTGGRYADSKPTGKVALNWTPDDRNLIYAFVARGYKSGAFTSPDTIFGPETVLDYEGGWKTSFLDGHVRTQMGAFYYDYHNFQMDVLNPETGQTDPTNLTNAQIYGFEAQIQAKFHELSFDAGAAYLHSKLGDITFVNKRDFNLAFPGASPLPQCEAGNAGEGDICYDYTPYIQTRTGGQNLYSPSWSFNVGAQYRFHLGEAVLTPRLNYAYIGSQYTYIGYSPVTDRLKAYGLVSGELSYKVGRYELTLYGTNLTDKKYISGQYLDMEYYGTPRQYGLRLNVDY
jgi:iron complex outermembrane receptor protein